MSKRMTDAEAMRVLREANIQCGFLTMGDRQHVELVARHQSMTWLRKRADTDEDAEFWKSVALAIESLSQSRECSTACYDVGDFHDPDVHGSLHHKGCPNADEEKADE